MIRDGRITVTAKFGLNSCLLHKRGGVGKSKGVGLNLVNIKLEKYIYITGKIKAMY